MIDGRRTGLLAAARGGDLDALEELLADAAPFARARLDINPKWRSVLDVDDVMQVTFLEAFLEFESFHGEVDSFPAWLRRIALNNLRDAVTELSREKRPPPERRVAARDGDDAILRLYARLTGGGTPSKDFSRQELRTLLEATIAELPADYAEVIRLASFHDLPLGDVAVRMNRSYGAVHLIWRRGLDRLAERLGAHASTLMERRR